MPIALSASRVTSHGDGGPRAQHTFERQIREDQEAQLAKLGVPIVGSFYWDLKLPRPRWRAERLDCAY